jgi:cytochrome c peroxidase
MFCSAGSGFSEHIRHISLRLGCRTSRMVVRGVAAVTCVLSIACSGPGAGRTASVPGTAPPASEWSPSMQRIHARYFAGLDTLASSLNALALAAEASAAAPSWAPAVREAFTRSRRAYKRVEVLVELEAGAAAQEINGAPVAMVDENDGVRTSRAPTGFQVVEAALFPTAVLSDSSNVRYQIELMQALVVRMQLLAHSTVLVESNLFDAVRLEVARVTVLGLGNADATATERGLSESADALRGVDHLIEPLGREVPASVQAEWSALRTALNATATALATADPEVVDRLALTRIFLVPLSHRWSQLREALRVPLPADARPWRASAASLFDSAAFDAWQFAPAYARTRNVDSAAALGASLFADTRLSGDSTRSCVSCHQPTRAFTDGRTRSMARRDGVLLRNAPTLLNAALQRLQFADARAVYLEDQVADVVRNTHELGGTLTDFAARLRADPAVFARFGQSFGEALDSTVTAARVARALAAYERTLLSLDAPFDRYVRGDTIAMNPLARRGYSVFMGKGKCGTCHFPPLFNGTVPPLFARSESEVIGTPATSGWTHVRADADSGRAKTYTADAYLRAFKTPTVRNAALTAPYMHNGVYATLDEVIEFYNRGGGAGLGLRVPNQTLPFDRLRLTRADARSLIAFMNALTDTSSARVATLRY